MTLQTIADNILDKNKHKKILEFLLHHNEKSARLFVTLIRTTKTHPTKIKQKLLDFHLYFHDKKCKKNLGKPFSDVLLAVPQLNVQEKY